MAVVGSVNAWDLAGSSTVEVDLTPVITKVDAVKAVVDSTKTDVTTIKTDTATIKADVAVIKTNTTPPA